MAFKFLTSMLILIILLGGSTSFLTTSQGSVTTPSNYNETVSPSANPMHYVNFTAFSDTPGNVLNSITMLGRPYGMSARVYGNIISVSAPERFSHNAVAILSSISDRYGISFFNSTDTITYTPLVETYAPLSEISAGEYYPSDIYRAYNYTGAFQDGIFGNGTTIVIIDAYGDPSLLYDLSAFDNLTGLPPTDIETVYLNTTPLSYNRGWSMETALDVEWAHASAPGAKIVVVLTQNAGSSLEDAVSYAIYKHLGNIISLSWGAPESNITQKIGLNGLNTLSQIYYRAYVEGITIVAASGDGGGFDNTGKPAVNFPASDPYVLGVGGTSLFRFKNSYTEKGWGGFSSGSTFGSGGGFSDYFHVPWWQKAPGFNSNTRGVPDVSAIANKYTGVLMVNRGSAYQAGGTSLSTPIWAGIVSLLDEQSRERLGFINPLLYQISRSPLYRSSFNDVTSGSNGVYNASTGWDPVTGLGTPNVGGLLHSVGRIIGPSGFRVYFNNTTNAVGVQATLTLNGSIPSMYKNGTAYYFESIYGNPNDNIDWGIAVNDTGLYSLLQEKINGHLFNESTKIKGYPFASESIPLSLKIVGFNLSMRAGSYMVSHRLFYPSLGSSIISLGLEIFGGFTNMTLFPEGAFHSINFINSNQTVNRAVAYEAHFSDIPGLPQYSGSSGILENSTLYVKFSGKRVNGFLTNSTTTKPAITYSLQYRTPLEVTLGTTDGYKISRWIVNGGNITGNSFTVNSTGIYNITALSPKGNITRSVFLERTYNSQINLSNPVSGYLTIATITVNEFWSYDLSINASRSMNVTTLNGVNELEIGSPGYYNETAYVMGGGTIEKTLSPLSSTVVMYISPTYALVKVDGLIAHHTSAGLFRANVLPGIVTINVSASGYHNYSARFFANPGADYTRSVYLLPSNPDLVVKIEGDVKDSVFQYPIVGALFIINSSIYTYTNSSGHFVLYLPPGKYVYTIAASLYRNASGNFSALSNITIKALLQPAKILPVPYISIFFGSSYSILFFLLYSTWSSQTPVVKFTLYYSTSPEFKNPDVINLSGTATSITLTVMPFRTYYLQLFGYTANGSIVSSKEIAIHPTTLTNIIINLLIYSGIIVYLYYTFRILRRLTRRSL